MDKQERKDIYEEVVNGGLPKLVANFHSWRAYVFSNLKPINWLMNKAYSKWAEPILKEEDHEALVKKHLLGKLEVIGSYGVIFGSAIAAYSTGDIAYTAGAGLGAYLNWKGELEMNSSKQRMNELNVDWERTVDKWFEKYKKD